MSAPRPATTLRLSSGLRDKVLRSGYGTVADLRAVPTNDLVSELKLSSDQARELLHQLHPTSASWEYCTANQTLELEQRSTPITTSSPALDSLFGGGLGVPPGKITEICGLPGTGKTQLGIQLCVNAQMPTAMGGAGGTSIYVDTEGSFIAKRALQFATACFERLSAADNDKEIRPALDSKDLMQGIQYCRVHSPVELIAMVRMLSGIVRSHPKTKLIVVDSIAFLFRSNLSDINMRTKLVATLGRQLSDLARTYNVAVVVINQMTTKVDVPKAPGLGQSQDMHPTSLIQPALGETWANMCTHRIRLYNHGDGQRTARLFKSPTIQEQTVAFQILSTGISDAEDMGRPLYDDAELELDPEESLLLWGPIDDDALYSVT
ncbi:DNA repair protein rad51c [Dissophora globulifera]|nr:DNA repair protein rad51c [Dissophora globulifera]